MDEITPTPLQPDSEPRTLTCALPLATGRHGLGGAIAAIQAAEEALDLARRRSHVAELHEMFHNHPWLMELAIQATPIQVSASQSEVRLRIEPIPKQGFKLGTGELDLVSLRFTEALSPFIESAGSAMDGVRLGREQMQVAAAWILRAEELEDWMVDFESHEIGRAPAKQSLADAVRARL